MSLNTYQHVSVFFFVYLGYVVAKSDHLANKKQMPQITSTQVNNPITDQRYTRNNRQWQFVNPSLQQQMLGQPASYYMYNYLSPHCFWMDQTNQPSPSMQAVTPTELKGYHPAAYLYSVQQNTLGGSYQFAYCQPEYKGQSATSPPTVSTPAVSPLVVSQPALSQPAISSSVVSTSAVYTSPLAVSRREEDTSSKAEEQQILITDTVCTVNISVCSLSSN